MIDDFSAGSAYRPSDAARLTISGLETVERHLDDPEIVHKTGGVIEMLRVGNRNGVDLLELLVPIVRNDPGKTDSSRTILNDTASELAALIPELRREPEFEKWETEDD